MRLFRNAGHNRKFLLAGLKDWNARLILLNISAIVVLKYANVIISFAYLTTSKYLPALAKYDIQINVALFALYLPIN